VLVVQQMLAVLIMRLMDQILYFRQSLQRAEVVVVVIKPQD
jgi:hypothetical protein